MALLRVQVKICLPRDMTRGRRFAFQHFNYSSQLFMSHLRRAGMSSTMTSAPAASSSLVTITVIGHSLYMIMSLTWGRAAAVRVAGSLRTYRRLGFQPSQPYASILAAVAEDGSYYVHRLVEQGFGVRRHVARAQQALRRLRCRGQDGIDVHTGFIQLLCL